jgi:phosphatidylglycerol---prolipoprotein diacylglyceryl transferase
MYPNLYYVFKDWFGIEVKPLGYLNTFGLMVAVGFVVAAMVIAAELKRKEKQGLLLPREEMIEVGQPASIWDLLINFITGFFFGFKLLGLLIDKPEEITAPEYIFSGDGSWPAGLLLGGLLAGLKWWEKKKQQLKQPEQRVVRIWPHDRVGDIVVVSLISGILGAKLFDNLENWSDFVAHPMERLLSAGGLTFYGGLIVATIAVAWYGKRKGINLLHLADAIAPAMMLAYAVGRIGCQVSGDGDWGIYNSAYITDTATGKSVLTTPAGYNNQLNKFSTYFLEGKITDAKTGQVVTVTDRKSNSLAEVPNKATTAPSFLPNWLLAYSYPQNVNNDGVTITALTGEHNRALPVPVYPTPLYETLACSLLFLLMWSVRKRIKTAGIITGIYLFLNGLERFFIEKIRVNNVMNVFGIEMSQAELIASILMLAGIVWLLFFGWLRKKAS